MTRFTHFIRKVFAVKILLSGKFLLFLTLEPTWEQRRPPLNRFCSQIYHRSTKVLHGTQGALSVSGSVSVEDNHHISELVKFRTSESLILHITLTILEMQLHQISLLLKQIQDIQCSFCKVCRIKHY